MIDNFLDSEYHSYDNVYNHLQTKNAIFIGDVQSAMDLQFIKSKNIRTGTPAIIKVVTAATYMSQIVYDRTISHMVYPLLDSKSEDVAKLFDGFYLLVENSMVQGSLLVHCAAGISRSSTLVISYIMKKQKMSFREAIALVRQKRPAVLPNLGFERQLKKYQQALKKGSINPKFTKRSDVKTCESGKANFSAFKTQVIPLLGVYGQSKLKQKLITLNLRNMVQKFSDKDIQILKIYNHGQSVLRKTRKRFNEQKKQAICLHNLYMKEENYKSELPERVQMLQYVNSAQMEKKRILRTPFLHIKKCYIQRKSHGDKQRWSPTQRGLTFYNLRKRHQL